MHKKGVEICGLALISQRPPAAGAEKGVEICGLALNMLDLRR